MTMDWSHETDPAAFNLSREALLNAIDYTEKQGRRPSHLILSPRQFNAMRYIWEGGPQNRMWNQIGAGILPWIPQTFTFFRRLRRKVRLGVGMFLVDHGLIEVEEDW